MRTTSLNRLEAATHLIYASVIVAALARGVCAALEVDHTGALLAVAGIAWAAAFLGFAAALFGGVLVVAPVLTSDKAFI